MSKNQLQKLINDVNRLKVTVCEIPLNQFADRALYRQLRWEIQDLMDEVHLFHQRWELTKNKLDV